MDYTASSCGPLPIRRQLLRWRRQALDPLPCHPALGEKEVAGHAAAGSPDQDQALIAPSVGHRRLTPRPRLVQQGLHSGLRLTGPTTGDHQQIAHHAQHHD